MQKTLKIQGFCKVEKGFGVTTNQKVRGSNPFRHATKKA